MDPDDEPEGFSGRNVMSDWEHRMREALLAAAEQFAIYADYHLAKEPPDREKARTNVEWSARCREAAKVPDAVTSAKGT